LIRTQKIVNPSSLPLTHQSSYLGSNSRARGDKARKIGWKPTHTTADFYEAIRDEVKEILVHAGPGMEKLVFNPIFSELAAVPPS
jgi:hypothetical protein